MSIVETWKSLLAQYSSLNKQITNSHSEITLIQSLTRLQQDLAIKKKKLKYLKTQNSCIKNEIISLKSFIKNPSTNIPLNDIKQSTKVLNILSENNISYKYFEHEPVFTCEQAREVEAKMKKNGINIPLSLYCKNFFLVDKNKKMYIFICLESTKIKLDKTLVININKCIKGQQKIKQKLSFGKEDLLESKLSIVRGAVGPFSMLNDNNNEVILLIEKRIVNSKLDWSQYHPNTSKATLIIKSSDLLKLFDKLGKIYFVIDL